MLVSIVVPLFNEEQALPIFHEQLMQVLATLQHDFEVWYVDDGSTDKTYAMLRDLHQQDNRVKLLKLSRNYGHQAALTAGLDFCRGQVAVSLDGDGQHPPSLIPKMIEAYEQGNDVVLTQRQSTEQINRSLRLFSHLFYKIINSLSSSEIIPDAADFRLLAREVVDELGRMREQHRFLRGMISWMGYQQIILPFDAPSRVAGHTSYTLRKRLRLAFDAIFSFSTMPVNLAILAGMTVILIAALYTIYVVLVLIVNGRQSLPPGWASLMLAILVIGGAQLITIGIVGHYVGVTFQEAKRRPVYFVNRRLSTLDEQREVILDQPESR